MKVKRTCPRTSGTKTVMERFKKMVANGTDAGVPTCGIIDKQSHWWSLSRRSTEVHIKVGAR